MTTKKMIRRRYTPPASSGVFYCALCDGSFSPADDDVDVERHEQVHARMLKFEKQFGHVMTRAERSAAEDEAARVFSRTRGERVAAAESVLRANYHRHMRIVAKSGRADRSCTETEFIAAASLERMFPADVAAELRRKHGTLTRPEIAMTDWNYPP